MYKRIWLKFMSLNREQEDKGQLDHDDSAEKIMPYKIERNIISIPRSNVNQKLLF